MSVWKFDQNLILDDKKENCVLVNGAEIGIRKQCWNLLRALLNNKTKGKYLYFEEIDQIMWDGKTSKSSKEDRKRSISTAVREIKNTLGRDDLIKSVRNVGYRLNVEAEILPVANEKRLQYLEALWNNHVSGSLRDMVGTGNVRELIDFYVAPKCSNARGDVIKAPFRGSGYIKLLKSGSGFGKSTLLDMVLLCQIVDRLAEIQSPVISENSRSKLERYQEIRRSWFCGEGSENHEALFPVFIHADDANQDYAHVLELADAHEVDTFEELLQEANGRNALLFLIDSIDEIKKPRLETFLEQVSTQLRKDYPNARFILSSRFSGRLFAPFAHEVLHIEPLELEGINAIARAIEPNQEEADRQIMQYKTNQRLFALARNPFSLMVMLEDREFKDTFHKQLQNIVGAIIDRRWEKYHQYLSPEDIRRLFGYVSCKMMLEKPKKTTETQIRKYFREAVALLERYQVPFQGSTEEVEAFLTTLSCQSGILNIVEKNHDECYEFQDQQVACWLAANFIHEVLQNCDEFDSYGTTNEWPNVWALDKLLHAVYAKKQRLSSQMVDTLAMTLVMCEGPLAQQSILYYLIVRDAVTLDKAEHDSLSEGFRSIRDNVFGPNRLTNEKDSEANKLIRKMLHEDDQAPASKPKRKKEKST